MRRDTQTPTANCNRTYAKIPKSIILLSPGVLTRWRTQPAHEHPGDVYHAQVPFDESAEPASAGFGSYADGARRSRRHLSDSMGLPIILGPTAKQSPGVVWTVGPLSPSSTPI